MADETTPEDTPETPEEESSDTPKKSEVEKVNSEYDQLKEANDKVEAELLRTEQLKAKARLGGQSEAGQKPAKEEIISNTDYADKLMKGEVDPMTEDGISIN